MSPERKFRFTLALALGKTVNELEQTLSVEEFEEWKDYYSSDPFGEQRADVRNALLCLVIAKCNGSKDAKLEDFLLYKESQEKDLEQDLFRFFMME